MGALKYEEITGKVIGAAFEVHKFLGNGFQEVIYQRALAYELREAGLPCLNHGLSRITRITRIIRMGGADYTDGRHGLGAGGGRRGCVEI